ncbi:zinc transporter foi isoform X2 [Eurytemora carolleeae]|uniref:zinc transporter foi isoform X1 n=1 Tax=Eurytemora carolleeae TaxID=1294199 RepID=UPI000C75791A|nr:zinc transporter foi isoform X1 [Eurytemora carolleeae]XP_023330775.1 zinc transporter foi isoform X2 [Eurytemora carolleeae]|eukprot:XP_023330774.1 zinc transporter foi-like isoform X1 [Eurytemora affinis]
MNRRIYQHAVQFLIALAVGTLTGDALLHLLPHAIMGGDSKYGHHGHGTDLQNDLHKRAVWIGFVAAVAIIGFFLFEKIVNILGELRNNSVPDKNLRVVREGHVASDKAVGENICKHKYSAYCVQDFDIQNERTDSLTNGTPKNNKSDGSGDPGSEKTLLPVTEVEKTHKRNYSVGGNGFKSDQDTVIISHHETVHHGHSHAHSHIHSAPSSISSVAWMVIFGDGIHNLADGLAIGAAFADGMWSGVSTSVAVLCHELPHEIGDFAMLLKTGMSFKKAVFYNVVSSVLAFVGMLIGLVLGNLENFSSWMFAATAGVFLYVALVDMMPELSSGHTHPLSKENQTEGHFIPILLQLLGMGTGVGIMTIIALYEEDFKTLVSD